MITIQKEYDGSGWTLRNNMNPDGMKCKNAADALRRGKRNSVTHVDWCPGDATSYKFTVAGSMVTFWDWSNGWTGRTVDFGRYPDELWAIERGLCKGRPARTMAATVEALASFVEAAREAGLLR